MVLHEVSAQVACTQDSQCSSLGPEFRCISNRCNLPPPIWNLAPGTINGGQTGSFDVSGNSQVRGNFSIGTGFVFPAGAPTGSIISAGDIYSNALFSRVAGAGNIWIGDMDDTVQIQGALTVSSAIVNGNLTVAPGVSNAAAPQLQVRDAGYGLSAAAGQLHLWGSTGGFRFFTNINGNSAERIQFTPEGNIILRTAGATVGGVVMDNVLTGITAGDGITISGTGHDRAISVNPFLTNLTVQNLTVTEVLSAEILDVNTEFTVNGSAVIGGDLNVNGNLTMGDVAVLTAESELRWGQIAVFPNGCSPGQFVTAIGEELTCAADESGSAADGGVTYTAGQYVTIDEDNSISAVHSGICFGPVYQQPSALARNGARGGYVGANAECPAGMHVCKTTEILESINCGAFAGTNTLDGGTMWINNLAPSLPTPTNDCGGWQTESSSSIGIVYSYVETGGVSGTASCDQSLNFACCR